MEIIITGLVLGGTYALVALGLNIQYGISRIMNLANGELLVAGGLAAFWFWTAGKVSPLLALVLIAPVSFVANYLIYVVMLRPLVKRAKSTGELEVNSILATFGMAFVGVGLMLLLVGGQYFSYNYLSQPIEILGSNYSLNRVVALVAAATLCAAVYLWLHNTRMGMSIRALAVAPDSAQLVGVNVDRLSALAFAIGGAITAIGGALISTFLTLDPSSGVLFTLKALVIVIMGGVGDIRGTIITAVLLGLLETFVATVIDPGLTLAATYLVFVLVLLFRPQGFFGKPTS
ncbi:MAG: branched-chain amino acid ABC transporter permease [Alphaproteobacteria bacterium]